MFARMAWPAVKPVRAEAGWSIQELHAVAHGGAWPCDVVRLTRHAQR